MSAFQTDVFQTDAFQIDAFQVSNPVVPSGGTPVYPDNRKRKRRRNRDIDKALDQTFAYLKAREEYKRELENEPSPRAQPIILPPALPTSNDIASLAALQDQIASARAGMMDAARAIRQQREEEDIELLLMSL